MPRLLLSVLLVCLLLSWGNAATIEISPSNTQGEIDDAIASLAPGDVLRFANGTYHSISIDLTGKQGTNGSPITLTGPGPYGSDERPVIISDNSNWLAPVWVGTGAQYLVVTGLRLTHLTPTGTTWSGVGFESGVHDITISDCEIDHVSGIGVQMQLLDDIHSVTVQDCIIHHTGQNLASSTNGGQGLTVGTFDLDNPATDVYDIRWIGNAVYDNEGQEGDCMKFMYGVYASQMVDNVVWNCPRGHSSQTTIHGLAIYGGPIAAQSAENANTVSGNMVIGSYVSGNNNVGIYAAVGTRIINNVSNVLLPSTPMIKWGLYHDKLVIDSSFGIAVRPEGTDDYRHTVVIHNTVWRAEQYAFSVRDAENSDSTFVIANNVFAVDTTTWPNSVGYCWYQMTAPNSIVMNNYYDGTENCDGLDEPAFIKLTEDASEIFVSPGVPGTSAGPDFMCTGTLVDAGISSSTTGVTDDFDGSTRDSMPDVGCYEAGVSNANHWAILLGLKGSNSALAPGSGGSSSSSAATSLRPALKAYLRYLEAQGRL